MGVASVFYQRGNLSGTAALHMLMDRFNAMADHVIDFDNPFWDECKKAGYPGVPRHALYNPNERSYMDSMIHMYNAIMDGCDDLESMLTEFDNNPERIERIMSTLNH